MPSAPTSSDPDHRRRPDRHRPGVRVRLLRRAGVQGAARGGLPRRPGQLQPGDDHDRPGDGRRDLHRADHLADGRADHREGAARRAAADDGRADRAQLRARPRAPRRAREVRRRDDRRHARGDRQGRGPREVQGGDDADRPRESPRSALAHRMEEALQVQATVGFPAIIRPVVHARRHRRRHRLQPRGVQRDLRARPRRLARPARC